MLPSAFYGRKWRGRKNSRQRVYLFLTNTLEALRRRGLPKEVPHLNRYIEWMERQSTRHEGRELVHWRPDWSTLRHDLEYVNQVVSRVEEFSAEGKLHVEVGRSLLGILEGEIEALSLLSNGDLAADYYREASGT